MSDINIPKLPFIGFVEAKTIVESFLNRHGINYQSDLPIRLPVNIELLAVKTGCPVSTIDGLRSEFDLRGLVFKKTHQDNFEILIDSYHYQEEEYSSLFTIAEELAHILIHKSIFEQIRSIEDRMELDNTINESTRRLIEMQAKRVGSELLLPDFLFRPFMLKWYENNQKKVDDDRPIDKNDLLSFVSIEVGHRLGLSDRIIRRALERNNPSSIIDELIATFKVKFLSAK
jgi:Zn-dependent peptidase ImmA (M78 family)